MDSTAGHSKVLAVPFLGLALLCTCGGETAATAPGAPPDASGTGRADLGVPAAAPSPEGDGRLVDIPETPLGFRCATKVIP